MSRIAIIGWGSLLWDLDDLAPKVRGGWLRAAGPRLPLEFSRISPKRKQALVVIIDPEHGADCPSSVIESVRDTLDHAAEDLRAREITTIERIGVVDAATGGGRAFHPPLLEPIAAWCRAEGWTGAVWTDLQPDFAQKRGEPFSHGAAIAYFRALDPHGFAEGVRYMANAPPETDTKLRRRIAGEPWWPDAVARHA